MIMRITKKHRTRDKIYLVTNARPGGSNLYWASGGATKVQFIPGKEHRLRARTRISQLSETTREGIGYN